MENQDSSANETRLIESYREGTLSIGGLARLLDCSVLEADAWLAERAVPLNYSADDLSADRKTLQDLRDRQ